MEENGELNLGDKWKEFVKNILSPAVIAPGITVVILGWYLVSIESRISSTDDSVQRIANQVNVRLDSQYKLFDDRFGNFQSPFEARLAALDARIAGLDSRIVEFNKSLVDFNKYVASSSSLLNDVKWLREQFEKVQGEVMPVMASAKDLPQNFQLISKAVEDARLRLEGLDKISTSQKNDISTLRKDFDEIKISIFQIEKGIGNLPRSINKDKSLLINTNVDDEKILNYGKTMEDSIMSIIKRQQSEIGIEPESGDPTKNDPNRLVSPYSYTNRNTGGTINLPNNPTK